MGRTCQFDKKKLGPAQRRSLKQRVKFMIANFGPCSNFSCIHSMLSRN